MTLWCWLLPAVVQAQFGFSIANNQATVSSYSGTGGAVVIPSITPIFSYPVVGIAGSVFLNKSNITSITIPSSIVSIGDSAFSGCTGLTSIAFPDSVTNRAAPTAPPLQAPSGPDLLLEARFSRA